MSFDLTNVQRDFSAWFNPLDTSEHPRRQRQRRRFVRLLESRLGRAKAALLIYAQSLGRSIYLFYKPPVIGHWQQLSRDRLQYSRYIIHAATIPPCARTAQSPNSPNLCSSLVSSPLILSRLTRDTNSRSPRHALSPPRTHLASPPLLPLSLFQHKLTFVISIGLFSISSTVRAWGKVLPGISPVTGFPKAHMPVFYLSSEGKEMYVALVGPTTNISRNFRTLFKYFFVQLLHQNAKKAKIVLI